MSINIQKNQFWIFFIILCLLSLLMILLFMPLNEMNPGGDMLFHHRRFMVLANALQNGSFPVYLDYTDITKYGYGAKWFYSDFVLIPFAAISTFTGFVFSYKFMWFAITVLCGLFTYKMMNRIYKNTTAAYFTAIIYTFSAYRLQDIYERAAVGEGLAFTFIPIVFWGLYEIIKGNYKKWYIISIGFSLLIFSHLISSVFVFITVLIFILFYYKSFTKEPRRLLYLILAGIFTIPLSAYFLLPFLEQLVHTKFYMSQMVYIGYRGEETALNRFLKSIFFPHQLFVRNVITPCLGIAMTFCVILRFFVKEKTKYTRSIDLGLIVGFVCLLLTINIYDWNKYPLKAINFIQFSWRLFQLCTFFFSIAGGYYLAVIATKKKKTILVSSILILFIGLQLTTQSHRYKAITAYYYFPMTTSITDIDIHHYFASFPEYFSINFNDEYTKKKGSNIDTESEAKLSDITRKDGYVSLDVETGTKNLVEFPLTYYKGYNATLNNEKVNVEESKNGLVEVPIDKSGRLVVEFTGTFLQKYSIYITLISSILIAIYILVNRKKENE